MLASTLLVAFLGLIATFASCQDGAPIIEIKGTKFFYANNGSQFFIKGLVYQEITKGEDFADVSANLERNTVPFTDQLGDGSACARDLPYLRRLQINVVRTYSIENNTSHDECMNALAQAGIYTLIDLSQAGLTISPVNPVWNAPLYNQFTMVIDAMHKYTNVLGFLIGDQDILDNDQPNNAKYIRAAVRDMKTYMRQKNYRAIPLGYVDHLTVIPQDDKLDCGSLDETIDFFGVNFYTGDGLCEAFLPSSPIDLIEPSESLARFMAIPMFVATLDCYEHREDREFSEVSVVYNESITPFWSGYIVYEYFEQGDGSHGLIFLDDERDLQDLKFYDSLSSQMKSISPSGINAADYAASTISTTKCESVTITGLPPNPVALAASSTSEDFPSTSVDVPSSSTNLSSLLQQKASTRVRVGIGIGVGIAAAVAIGVALLFVLMRRRRRRRKDRGDGEHRTSRKSATDHLNPVTPEDPPQTDYSNAAEVEGISAVAEVPNDRQVYEKAGEDDSVRELPGTLRHSELPAGNEAAPFLGNEKS
ncbi:MAG: hypothetical protein Q9174_003043 [Haloplaca sp. 1 TL-2023]